MNSATYNIKSVLEADGKNYIPACRTFKAWLLSVPTNDQYCIWRYIKYMRYVEYYTLRSKESRTLKNRFVRLWYLYKLRKMSYATGFQIPPFTCGKGLTIWHWGSIVINENVRIGENCTLYPGVLIGWKGILDKRCPKIGNNVFIGAGTKIIGGVNIGDNVIIGQNMVITKDIPSGSVVVSKSEYRFLHK